MSGEDKINQSLQNLTIDDLDLPSSTPHNTPISKSLNNLINSTPTKSINKKTTPTSNNDNNNNNNNNNTIIGERAVQYFGYLVFSQDHIWRATPNCDIGIDGHIEFKNSKNSYSTKTSKALICGVQIKATTIDKNSSLNIESINYWKKYPLPVIIVQIYFQQQSSDLLPKCLYLTKEQLKINNSNINNSNNNINITPTKSTSEQSKVFDKINAKQFSCESVQEYCIEYMRNNFINYNENRFQDYLIMEQISKTKSDEMWVIIVDEFLKLKPTNQDIDYSNNIITPLSEEEFTNKIKNLFNFPLSLIKDTHKTYLKQQLISCGYDHNISLKNISDQIYHIYDATNKNNGEFNNLSKWFSYLYCIINNDPIQSIENDLYEMVNHIYEEVTYVYIMVLEMCQFIIPRLDCYNFDDIINNNRLENIKKIITSSKDGDNETLLLILKELRINKDDTFK